MNAFAYGSIEDGLGATDAIGGYLYRIEAQTEWAAFILFERGHGTLVYEARHAA